jgi:tetratricopeptide (TPR) repeat protein
MAVFASPSAAVSCAVAMQQGVERDNRRSSIPLGLRVGLSGGEVTAEQGDYFGDPVVEAARLCALCEGAQILATEAVRLMAGRRSPHVFLDVVERELKGLPDPVAVCEIQWEPVAGDAGIPLPERLESSANSVFSFIGRQSEVDGLLQAAKISAAGAVRTVFLCGEPGIGKTSLCRSVARAVHQGGMCVLYGRCDEDFSVAYQPFADALGHFVVHADEDLLRDHVSDNGGALLSLVPTLAKRLPDVHGSPSADPESERLRLFSAVVSLLGSASSNSGLLLVLDDLQWADRASLQLLRHIASSTQLQKVMILATYRDSELSAGNPLSDTVASLRRDSNIDRIDLVGLEEIEIIDMMEQVAGYEMDRSGVELAHAVRRETNGNPFFTTELLRHLAESGLIRQDQTGHWVASEDLYEGGLPQSVREVVGQRVDRLGEETRRVLSHAAVIGRDFDLGVLAQVADADEDSVLDLIDESVGAGLLTEVEGTVDRFSFSHALTQHTLYEDLGASRRARLHRRVADVLEQIYGDGPDVRAAELARHFVAATKTVDVMKALRYSRMAGEQALAQSAPADAVELFKQALDLYSQVDPDPALHCDLLIGLGTAQRCNGDPCHRQTLLDAAAFARELGDDDRLVKAALANSRGGVSSAGNIDEERLGVLEEALDALSIANSPERALLLGTMTAELSYTDPDRLAGVASEALDLARRLGDPTTLLRVTSLVYHGYVVPDNLEQRLTDLEAALSIASKNADPAVALQLHNSRAIACLQAGDGAGFDAHTEKCSGIAERLDQPFERWTASVLLCNQALLRAEAELAESHANGALAVAGDAVPEALTAYGVQLIEIRRFQGRMQELSGFLDVISERAIENPGLPVLQIVLARMYCDLGRAAEAKSTQAEAIALGTSPFPHDYARLPGLCNLAHVCVDLEWKEAARSVYKALLPWHDQVGSVGVTCQGPVASCLGSLALMLGDLGAAEEHYRRGLETGRRLQAPYFKILTCLGLATTLERRDDPGDLASGAALREDALVEAARHGLEHLVAPSAD